MEGYKGMDVTQGEVKNRLLAYIDLAIPQTGDLKARQWEELRRKLTALLEGINRAIHGNADRDAITQALCELASMSAVLLRLNPEMARNAYFAFSESIVRFFKEAGGHRQERTPAEQ
jgi:hypothetical protein